MNQALIYIASYAALPLFGISLAARANLPPLPRWGLAFLGGAALLAVEAMLYALLGIRWSVLALSLPLLVLSAFVFMKRRAVDAQRWPMDGAMWIAVVAAILGVLHLVLSIVSTRAVSADYLLFWGSKAVLFVDNGGISPELLRWTYFRHGMVEYPPLVPVFQAWGLLFSERMPWIAGAAMSAIFIAAAAPVIAALLARSHGPRFAVIAASFWTMAMANALVASRSGGNAEAMLVAYLSIAGAALGAGPDARWIAAIGLGGAAITKVEAAITVAALLVGLAIRDLILTRPRQPIRTLVLLGAAPAATLGIWVLFRWWYDLPTSRVYRAPAFQFEQFGPMMRAMGKELAAGSWWLAWLFPLAVLSIVAARRPRRLVAVVPHLLAVAGLFAFFFFLYLQIAEDPSMRIAWTLPRLSQPALSLLILAAAFASGNDSAAISQ